MKPGLKKAEFLFKRTIGSSEKNEYYFDSASQAYGNNLKFINGQYFFYNGDVDQNGTIDLSDVSLIYNDASNFITGNTETDITGDDIVDLNDLMITYNNSVDFVHLKRP